MPHLFPPNLASRSDAPPGVRELATTLRDALGEDDLIYWSEERDRRLLICVLPAEGVIALLVADRSAVRSGMRTVRFDESLLTAASNVNAELGAAVQGRVGQELKVVLALPGLSRRALARASLPSDTPDVLCQDDLKRADIVGNLKSLLDGRPLGKEGTGAVRAVVTPEIVIDSGGDDDGVDRLFSVRPESDAAKLRVLDERQEQLAFHLGDGYRVIRGPAGSGKTLVILKRARLLAERHPAKKILVLCYNRALAGVLRRQLSGVTNVKVINVHRLAWDLMKQAPSDGDWDGLAAKAAERATPSYFAVFVDEAQDFTVGAWRLAWRLLETTEGSFVVALDGGQSVYRAGQWWRPEGISARGRTTKLDMSYRNTREIAEFAFKLIEEHLAELSDLNADDPLLIVRPEYTDRHGPPPQVLQCGDVFEECRVAAQRVKELVAEGVDKREIAVLAGNYTTWATMMPNALADAGIDGLAIGDSAAKDTIGSIDAIACGSLVGLKGLEFKHVVCLDVDGGSNQEDRARALYVAFTRAVNTLTVAVSGPGAMATALPSL